MGRHSVSFGSLIPLRIGPHLGQDLVAVVHFDFESGGIRKDEVVCTHSRVDGVDGSDPSAGGGNEAANCRGASACYLTTAK